MPINFHKKQTILKPDKIMEKGLIAVIMPVYNAEKTIGHALDSLLRQTYTLWKCIIIDDGSTDSTPKILKNYEGDSRFIIKTLKLNRGRGFARKMALEVVKEIDAEYMAMLDADDFYYKDKLSWQYEYMTRNTDITLLSSSMVCISDSHELDFVLTISEKECSLKFDSYLDYKMVLHASSIIRVKDIGEVSYDAELKFGQDQDFMMRLLRGKRYSYVPKISYAYLRGSSFSFQKYRATLAFKILSLKKMGISSKTLSKMVILNHFKVLAVGLISILGLTGFFLKSKGRKPTVEELEGFLKQV